MATDARGVALIDLVCALALAGVLSAMAVPVVAGSLERERTLVGAHALAGALQRARMDALRRATGVALLVEVVDERTRFRQFADGNGNGVLQRDIDHGVDRPIAGSQWLDQHAGGVSLRINQPVPDIGGAGMLSRGDDPLRIGRTSLVAFSPLGGSTSGTIYIAATTGPQMAIRIFGATGRTRLLTFSASAQRWEP